MEGNRSSHATPEGNTQKSCWSAAPGWSSTPAVPLLTWRATSTSTPRPCASGWPGRGRRRGQALEVVEQRGARGAERRCAVRCASCVGQTTSSSPPRRSSPPSSSHAERSERLYRAASGPLRGRADLQDPGGVGLRPLRVDQGGPHSPTAAGALDRPEALRRGGRPLSSAAADASGRDLKRRQAAWKAEGTTTPAPAAQLRPDLVQCDFSATAPDRLWVGDFTYLRFWEGISYLRLRNRLVQPQGRRLADWLPTCVPTSSSTPCRWPRPARHGADFELLAILIAARNTPQPTTPRSSTTLVS